MQRAIAEANLEELEWAERWAEVRLNLPQGGITSKLGKSDFAAYDQQ